MKKPMKWLILLSPVILLILFISLYVYQTSLVDDMMQDANGLVLGSGDNRLTVRVDRSVENEVTTDVITVTDPDGGNVMESVVSMDHDLYGTGFVKAMEADGDPDLEIVVWGNNIRQGDSFFLDYTGGNIVKRPLSEVSTDVIRLIDDYRMLNTQYPLIFGLLIFVIPAYYIIYLVVYLIMKSSAREQGAEADA